MAAHRLGLSISSLLIAASAFNKVSLVDGAFLSPSASGPEDTNGISSNFEDSSSASWFPWNIFGGGSSFSRQRLSPDHALSLYQCLHYVNAIFVRRNITYWAGGGTLLGAFRNNGLIPHDDDVDLHIPESQFSMLKTPEMKADLERNGMVLFHKNRGQYGIMNMSHGNAPKEGLVSLVKSHPPPFWIDVFEMKLHDDKWKFVKTDPRRNYFFKDRWFVGNVTREPLQQMKFGSTTVPTPSQDISEAYLNKVFGSDWKTTTACRRSFHACHLGRDKKWALSHHAEPDGPLFEARFNESEAIA